MACLMWSPRLYRTRLRCKSGYQCHAPKRVARARAAAHQAQNTELGAFVLCNMSHLASWRGQARIGIDHALAAQGWAIQTDDARLQAYAFDVGARALAMDG